MLTITEKPGHVVIRVRVHPGAARNALAGEIAGALKLRIAAPPVDGKANEECRRFLASILGVAPTDVEIKAGASSRNKSVILRNITVQHARQCLEGRTS